MNDIMRPGKPLPSKELMVRKALEILDMSPHGQQLRNFAERKDIKISIIETVEPATHIPEIDKIYLGFNKNNPVSPAYLILMLTGALREAQQNMAGIRHPALHAPINEHLEISFAKYEDTVWYICNIALELDEQEQLKDFKFLDELRKMGYNEALELVKKQKTGDLSKGG